MDDQLSYCVYFLFNTHNNRSVSQKGSTAVLPFNMIGTQWWVASQPRICLRSQINQLNQNKYF